ncbi:MAG TPA: hypothetical protein VLH38_04105 [Patescibacteria group bacterium]|nr:hypothetical protein [Patescibacteria group bacterium]
MNPEQPGGPYPPAPGSNPYEFITTENKAAKKARIPGSSNPFIMKLVLIIGSAVILVVVLAFIATLIFGSKTDFKDLISIAATQQEIIRIASLQEAQATDQSVAGAAISTKLTMQTQQQNTLTYLGANHTKYSPQQLALKKNSKTDTQIKEAQATSTFDITFTQIMRGQLQDYAAELKTTYANATGKKEKILLSTDYKQVEMLLQQWPK